MIEKIEKFIKKNNLIEKNDFILVALSGGADSICLLDILLKLREKYNLKIASAHLNHGVRGEEAIRDQNFAKSFCEERGILFVTKTVDMNGYAKENKISKEAAGRILRYEFLEDTRKKLGAEKIATAHNLNDNAETVLMRIIRGTGVDGLAGIKPKNGVVIRPLLETKREEIESYIEKNNLEYVSDSTNFENDYERNRIRNLLIPYLEENFNPNILNNLINLSELSEKDASFMSEFSKNKFYKISKREKGGVKFLKEDLKNLSPSILGRVIREAFYFLNGNTENLNYKNIQDIIELIDNESGKFIDNICGISIRNSYSQLIFETDKIKSNEFYFELKSGRNKINDFNIFVEEKSQKENTDKNSILIPKSQIKGKLVARNRKAGDRIKPFGLNGEKKLKDIFIDKKIDRDIRDKIPIIVDEEKIIWVSGITKSEIVNLEDDKFIKLTIE